MSGGDQGEELAGEKLAQQFREWLETALRAERQELQRRHSLLVEECMQQHGTLLARGTEIIPGQAGAETWQEQLSPSNDAVRKKVDQDLPKDLEANETLKQMSNTGAHHAELQESADEEDAPAAAQTHVGETHHVTQGFEDILQDTNNDMTAKEHTWLFQRFVLSYKFELVFSVLILMNTVTMALESQYHGFDVGRDVQYPRYDKTSEETWPGMNHVFTGVEWGFGILFTIEILARMLALNIRFVRDPWNGVDTLIVVGWIIDDGGDGVLPIDPMFLRLGCIVILFWAFLLIVLTQAIFAFLLNQLLVNYYIANSTDEVAKREIFKYFGTFSRSMLSMFEITLGNWAPIARLLLDTVSEWFMIFALVHKLIMGFAFVGIINGIFMQESFKVASSNDTLMLMQKKASMHVHEGKMQALFEAADKDGSGICSMEEFRGILKNPKVRTWLAAQEVHLTHGKDGDKLYTLLTHGTGRGLTARDLVLGIGRFKGTARGLDVIMLMHQHAQLRDQHDQLQNDAARMQQCISSTETKVDGNTVHLKGNTQAIASMSEQVAGNTAHLSSVDSKVDGNTARLAMASPEQADIVHGGSTTVYF